MQGRLYFVLKVLLHSGPPEYLGFRCHFCYAGVTEMNNVQELLETLLQS